MNDNLRYRLRMFLLQHQAAGWFVVAIAASLLVQFLLYVVLGIASPDHGEEWFMRIMGYLAMPASVGEFVTQPWSLFTWPLVSLSPLFHFENADTLSLAIFRFLFSGLIFFMFGRVAQQFYNGKQIRSVLLYAVPAIGLVVLLAGTVALSLNDTWEVTYLSGMTPIVVTLIVTTAMLVPDFSIRLFLFGNVQMKWIAIVFCVLEFISAMVFTPTAWGILAGAALGAAYVVSLRQGTNWVETLDRWFFSRRDRVKSQPSAPKAKEAKVKPMRRSYTSGSAKSATSRSETDGPVEQEELDQILDKISASGYESLTRIEKEKLLRASKDSDG